MYAPPLGLRAPDRLRVRALAVAERIDSRATSGERVSPTARVVPLEEGGSAIVYRYGCVVFFDVPPARQQQFVQDLGPSLVDPIEGPETEEIEFRLAGGETRGGETSDIVLAS